MSHTVGKLAALVLVVGIGAAVVIQAQRSIPDSKSAKNNAEQDSEFSDDSADGKLAADGEDGFDDENDNAVVSAAEKSGTAGRRDSKVVAAAATGGRKRSTLADDDDNELDIGMPSRAAASDPFANDDDDELDSPPQKYTPSGRETAVKGRSNIDIVDIDEDDTPRSKPKTSRGAAISNDDRDSDELDVSPRAHRKHANAGPRLAAGTDEPADDLPVGLGEEDRGDRGMKEPDDAIPDEDPIPVARNEKPLAVEEEIDREAEPRELPAEAPAERTESRSGRLRFSEDENETPTEQSRPSRALDRLETRQPEGRNRRDREPEHVIEPEPSRSGPSLPEVELNPRIEIDDATPTTPPPPRVLPTPKITIEKQAPESAVLGKPMVYHIIVRNVGKIPAHQVVVEDVIPTEVEIDGSIPQALLKDDHLIWKLGTLAAGHEKKIAVRVIPRSEGTVGGVATVHFAREPQGVPVPQLKFDVSAPKQATVESPVAFTFQVSNIGTVPAKKVVIRDVLPAGLRHPGGDDLEYNLGELPPGKSQEVTLELVAAKVGPTTNRVVVTADGNVTEEAAVELNIVAPSLKVSRKGPTRMFPGKTASFTNTVANSGSRPMAGINIQEKIPPGMKFISAGEGGFFDETKRTVYWLNRQLGAGESRTVTVTLQATERGAQISVVRAIDSYNQSGETAATVKVAGAPALTIEIGEIPPLVEPGETIRIPARILNRGSDTATKVKVVVKLPPQLKLISADGPTSYREGVPRNQADDGTVELQFEPIDKIDPKKDGVFDFRVQADQAGAVHITVEAVCEQSADPIQRQEMINIVNQ